MTNTALIGQSTELSETAQLDYCVHSTDNVTHIIIDSGSGHVGGIIIFDDHDASQCLVPVPFHLPIQLSADITQEKLIKEITASRRAVSSYGDNDISSNTCTISDRFSCQAGNDAHDLKPYHVHKFSAEVKAAYMSGITSIVQQAFAQSENPIHLVIRGTAAFREAGAEGEQLLRDTRDNLHELFAHRVVVDFQIISQRDEGIGQFFAVLAHKHGLPNNKLCVFDVGGGSIQWTICHNRICNEHFPPRMFGGTFAAAAAKKLINEKVIKPTENSIYPWEITDESINTMLSLLNWVSGIKGEDWLAVRMSRCRFTVIGVGSVHNFAILGVMHALMNKPKHETSYTRAELKAVIKFFASHTREALLAKLPDGHAPYLEGHVSIMLLVLAKMEKLNIPRIEVMPISNVDPVLLSL